MESPAAASAPWLTADLLPTRRPMRRSVLACALCLAGTRMAFARTGGSFTIGGVGSIAPLVQRLAQAYQHAHPETRIDIVQPPMGTGGSLRALSLGRVHLVLAGRPLQAGERGHLTPWLQTPLVFASSDGVLARLDAAKVQAVFAGRLLTWDDGRPIRIVLRGAQESETQVLRAVSPGIDRAVGQALERRDLPMAADDLDALEFLARIPGSFGTSSLGLVLSRGAPLRLLPYEGVAPTAQALEDGRYPLARPYHLVYRPDAPPEVLRFVEHLRSPSSLRLARSLDYLPVER